MTKVVKVPAKVEESAATLKRTDNAKINNEKLATADSKSKTKGAKVAEVKKPATKKAPKVRAESNVHIGERLLSEKANEATILATFTKVYKDKKNITDTKFVQARANIYMTIAKKKAEAVKPAKKAKAA